MLLMLATREGVNGPSTWRRVSQGRQFLKHPTTLIEEAIEIFEQLVRWGNNHGAEPSMNAVGSWR